MAGIEKFVVKYAESMVALIVALSVIFFVLYFLKTHAPGAIGTIAGEVGSRASGDKYQF